MRKKGGSVYRRMNIAESKGKSSLKRSTVYCRARVKVDKK